MLLNENCKGWTSVGLCMIFVVVLGVVFIEKLPHRSMLLRAEVWAEPAESSPVIEPAESSPVMPARRVTPRNTTTPYRAGHLEATWFEKPRAGALCETAISQLDEARLWVNYSSSAFSADGHPTRQPTEEEAAAISHIWTNGRYQPIEPLSGMARHPFAKVGCPGMKAETSIFDISYLILPNECGTNSMKAVRENGGHVLFYDMGCTTYGDGTSNTASGNNPSMPLFTKMYRDHCIEIDEEKESPEEIRERKKI